MKQPFYLFVVTGLTLLLTGCLKHELSTGLTESDAQAIIVLLKEHGLDADRRIVIREREEPSWTVTVRGGNQNVVQAWRILQENGMPREKVKGLEAVFEKPGMIPTAAEEKAKLLVGLSGEMSRTLRSVRDVVDARVHVVLPENSPLLDRSQWSPPSASVLLKYQNRPPLAEDEVKNLVAKGVEGLKPENIAVVMKKIEPKPAPAQDFNFWLSNQMTVGLALGILALSIGALLALLTRVRLQRRHIQRLQQMVAESSLPQAMTETAGRR